MNAKVICKILLLVFALFAIPITERRLYDNRLKPAENENIDRFLESRSEDIASIEEMATGEGVFRYVVLKPPKSGLLYWPSGPPVYKFDSDGNLVSWTSDFGEGWAVKNM